MTRVMLERPEKTNARPVFDTRRWFAQAQAEFKGEGSPCSGCSAACCWFVLIEDDTIDDHDDLREVGEHLSYEDFVLWIDDDGGYGVGLLRPCRWLNHDNYSCAAFGKPERPGVCGIFDEHHCWYRWHSEVHRGTCRVDGSRWRDFVKRVANPEHFPTSEELVAEAVVFDQPTRVWFDLPDDVGEKSDGPDDLLLFFSNFEGCQLARSEEEWSLVVETKRMRGVDPTEFEQGHEGAVLLNAQDFARLHTLASGPIRPMGVEQIRALLASNRETGDASER